MNLLMRNAPGSSPGSAEARRERCNLNDPAEGWMNAPPYQLNR
jgi:hypothetical protein